MPRLLCIEHGREHEAAAKTQRQVGGDDSESVLFVTGTLISGPWHCDKCNARLDRGGTASLMSFVDGRSGSGIPDYDIGYERRYFAMRGKEKVAVYGAACPWGDPVSMASLPHFD